MDIASLLSSSINVTVDVMVDNEVTTFRVFYRSSCRCAATHTGTRVYTQTQRAAAADVRMHLFSPMYLYSVYATCDGGLYTLMVCDLPLGILVCLSASPATANQAAPLVERVADKLRA